MDWGLPPPSPQQGYRTTMPSPTQQGYRTFPPPPAQQGYRTLPPPQPPPSPSPSLQQGYRSVTMPPPAAQGNPVVIPGGYRVTMPLPPQGGYRRPLEFMVQIPVTFQPPPERKRPLSEFWKTEVLNSNRRVALKKSKTQMTKCARVLKRLQNHHKFQTFLRRKGREEWKGRKQRRNALQVSRRIRPSTPPKCALWNCPKKLMLRRKQKAIGLLRRSGSRASVLSDMSKRSRSPIRMRDSPLLDRRGFVVSDSD